MAVYKQTCLLCNGIGTVKVPGKEITCPMCHGKKKVTSIDKERFTEWLMSRKTMWK